MTNQPHPPAPTISIEEMLDYFTLNTRDGDEAEACRWDEWRDSIGYYLTELVLARERVEELECAVADFRWVLDETSKGLNQSNARITELEAALAAERQRSSAYVEGVAQSTPVENG